MKKLLVILCSIILTLSINAQNIMLQTESKGVSKGNDQFSGFQATFSYDQIESVTITDTERGTFSALSVAGAIPAGETGTPELPVFKKFIAVPVNATPKVTVKNYTTTEYNLEEYGIHTVCPVQPDVPKNVKLEDVPFVYDTKAYSKDGYINTAIAEVEVLGTMRGVIIGMLVVRPIQYNPVANTIMTYNNIDVEVTFENGDYQKTQELYKNTYSPYFEQNYKVIFNRNLFDDHPDLYSTPVRMLVLAHSMFTETLQPWFEWKTKKGFYLDIEYVDNMTYTQIKTLCQTKYNQGASNGTAPTFVVIVGDIQQVPASKTGTGADGNKGSDLYYGSIDGDYFPEMYYSRLSAQTTQQLENQIEKILYYEKYQFADPSYLDNVLLIAGADGSWNPTVAQPTINYATNYYYNTAHGYSSIYAYLNSYSGCYNNLNTGVGFVNYTAHGSITAWSDPSFSVSNANSLTNTNKYFIAMGNCCLAADFNSPECLGEALMRGQQKGAVGYIGSCPLTYWHDDLHFGVGAYLGSWSPANPTLANTKDGIYDVSFRDADFNCLSSFVFTGNLNVTYAKTTAGYTADTQPIYYWEAYHVLGDGSLMPYNTQANDNEVSHLPVIYIGLPTYEVNALPGSYVAISKDGVLYGVAVADESGVATVTLNPPITSGGDVDIVVTRNQYKPYMAQVPAVAQSGPYIVPNGYTVVGNENILTYISTNTEIEVTLKNVGIEATTGLTVTIACSDPLLTINNGTATCNGIAPNGTTTIRFNITVSHDIPDNKSFLVDVTVTESGKTRVWESKMTLKAYKPILAYKNIAWQGGFSADETFSLCVIYENKGGARVNHVIGTLNTSNPNVTINNNDVHIGTMAPTGTGYAIFSITLSNTISENDPIIFTTQAEGDEGLVTTEGEFMLQNACTIRFEMTDSYGDGWDGNARISVRKDNTEVASVKLVSGASGTDICLLPSGELTFYWIAGSYDSECRFKIYNSDDVMIYNQSTTPTPGLFLTYNNQCTQQNGGCEEIKNLVITRNTDDISLVWEGNAQSYLILRDGITLDQITTTSYTDNHILSYEHTYCVFAQYANCSAFPICDNAQFKFCESPTNLELTDEGSTIIITWTIPENIDGVLLGYNIYRNETKLNETPITVLEYRDENLENGAYRYQISASYEHCESELTTPVTLNLSISDFQITSFKLFPNPTTGKVTIEGNGLNRVELYDIQGRMLAQYNNINEKLDINVNNYSNGIFFVKLYSNDSVVAVKRLVVIK
ncbi:MAG: C25 family cysteine peptidase [Bacteroidetes bacterium]|nr:C25 family cysteine peptidase [Bacteroidota bacterium]MCL1969250.1 C25 family cysteine peptidase [Bacteroidota bacterium]